MTKPLPSREELQRGLKRDPSGRRIYLDWNATSPLRPEAWEAMQPFFSVDFGNAESLHQDGQRARAALERARESCARTLACDPTEIVFTSGGTESNNLALRGLAWANVAKPSSAPKAGTAKKNKVQPKAAKGPAECSIVCSAIEHSAVRETVRALGVQGFGLRWVSPRPDGVVEMQKICEALDDQPRNAVVTLMYANNETGVIQPVAEVGKECRARGFPVHVDAVQAPGKLPLNVGELGCDTLSLSSHKFEGPKGVGLLYVRRGTRLVSHMTGGSHERNLRGGTHNVAGIVGMAQALRLAEAERKDLSGRLFSIRASFEQNLLERISEAVVHGAGAERLPNTSYISFPGLEGESLVRALDVEGVSVSSGAACSEGMSLISHVLTAMGVPEKVAQASVRFSFGRLTTEEDLRAALERVAAIVARIRKARPGGP